MILTFREPKPAIEFAYNNSLIAYYDPLEDEPFVAADDTSAQLVALHHRQRVLWEPCEVGGLHTWVRAPRPNGALSPNYWCDECHEDPPSVAIVGVQGLR